MSDVDKFAHPDFFKGKYDHENVVTRPILANFFASVHALFPDEAKKILEVGCGPGHSTQRLSRMLPGRTYDASDVDPTLVSYTQERNPTLHITCESIYDLSHPTSSYDVVLSLEVFEHLADPPRALDEVFRVTNRWAILSVPNEPLWRILNMCRGKYWSQLGNTPGHVNHWSQDEFVRFVENRFHVLSVESPIPWTVLLCEKKASSLSNGRS